MKKVSILAAVAMATGLASCTAQAPKATLKTDVDSLSYAIGISQTQGLKDFLAQRMDTAYIAEFLKGVNDAANKTSKKDEAYVLGLQIGSQMAGPQAIKGMNHQLFADDSTMTVNKGDILAGVFAGVLLDVLDDLFADGLLRDAGGEVERVDLLDVVGVDGGRNLGQHRDFAEQLHHVDPDVGAPAERLGKPLLILFLGERRVVLLHEVDIADDLVGIVHGVHRIVPHGGCEFVVAVDLVLFDGHSLRFARAAVGVVGAAFGQDDELVPVVLEVALHVVVHGRKLAFEQFAGVDGRFGVTRAGGVVLGVHGFGEFFEAARRSRDNQRKHRSV